MKKTAIFWFRRDLRIEDNAGLYHALKSGIPVQPIFIFDKEILSKLNDPKDARITFLHDTIENLNESLKALGSSLLVKYGKPKKVWTELLNELSISSVYYNHDFEPYALARDKEIEKLLAKHNIEAHSYKDHVIFEKDEVVKKDGLPYTVFTPYSKIWKQKLNTKDSVFRHKKNSFYFDSYDTEKYFDNFKKIAKSYPLPGFVDLGFERSNLSIPSTKVARSIIKKYSEQRDFPAIKGTSRLGIHYRFGTISIREKARTAQSLNETYLNELIWRDFYAQILHHFPHVVTGPFREKYKYIEWRNDEDDFAKWCAGNTGYPIVDAGMRELNQTGFMHNRVRMIVASFLTKHLLIDWQWGEAYFAEKLLDFDLASNNGGWQWAAGCGTDAAPYFRIFNPTSQQQKFDAQFKYIKEWVPEFGTDNYPEPMIDHKLARIRCLETYKSGLERSL